MPVLIEILLGAMTLLTCAAIHIVIMAAIVARLKKAQWLRQRPTNNRRFGLIAGVFLVALFSHTIQIYVCAFSLWAVEALQGYEEPIYFALVTYTTVGYGDVVIDPGFRIMGAMISVTGILMFGMTTAFLVGLFARILGEREM